MPANISGSSISSLGCSSFRRSTILGKQEDILQYSMGSRTIRFSVGQMNKHILSTVTRQNTKELSAWKQDEKKVYPSRLVNMGIDKFCAENNTNITKKERERVFAMISNDFGIPLDPKAAQSSINHIINGSGWFGKKLASFCEGMARDEKNRTIDILINHLADRFFESHISNNINIKKLQNDVGSYISQANAITPKE
ncbi:bfpT-regulated chaperone [Escherichia coli]|uniref:bfpT-regulated chaperone n=1 Tax=Escherichia coli TaxID=562 RepID=UPI0006A146A3|nr:bfpT-regulated chaperone [Escherichia coli]EFB6826563.1 bfpT-regulated chaperone [Escherichia coli]EFH3495623.1 bfpT-regulated chaperone [Escherichia coli]EHW2828369.1 bfpT-regulated chaperone [Escherichia coli]EKA9859085.1 bfpT-regulated chaperone [Escherichia coli]EKH7480038.1 bfpT-regulated chaperone [Escherichia coli]